MNFYYPFIQWCHRSVLFLGINSFCLF